MTLVVGAVLLGACRDNEPPVAPQPARLVSHGGARITMGDYTVIDIGTLGGSSATPAALNDSAVVVGTSITAAGVDHAFVWQNDTITDLHQPGWFSHSSAVSITNDGVIGGIGEETEEIYFPVEWRGRVPQNLTPSGFNRFGGDQMLVFDAMNQAADAIFHTTNFEDVPRGNAYLWHAGAVQNMGEERHGVALNASLQVVGTMFVGEFGAARTFFHGFVWQGGAARDLGVLSPAPCPDTTAVSTLCAQSRALAINTQGDIVGNSAWDSTGRGNGFVGRPVIWPRGGAPQQLAAFEGYGVAINDGGVVAGQRLNDAVSGEQPNSGFVWQNGVATDLGSLGGGHTMVHAMNQAGMIVGSSRTSAGDQHAFLWAGGQMIDLGTGPSGGTVSVATAINERGDIIGVSGTCRFPDPNHTFECGVYASNRGILWLRGSAPPPPPPPPVVTTVVMTPSNVMFDAIGATQTFVAQAFDQNGNAMPGQGFTWTVDDPSVATVDNSGTVTVLRNGFDRVLATAGGVTATASIAIRQRVNAVSLRPGSLALGMHDSGTLQALATDRNGYAVTQPITFTWSSSDPAAVSIEPTTAGSTTTGSSTATAIRNRPRATAKVMVAADSLIAAAAVGWQHGNGQN